MMMCTPTAVFLWLYQLVTLTTRLPHARRYDVSDGCQVLHRVQTDRDCPADVSKHTWDDIIMRRVRIKVINERCRQAGAVARSHNTATRCV